MSVCADEGGTKRRHASIYHNIVLFFQNPRTQREIVCNAATLGTAAASIRRWAKKESLRRVKRRNEVPSHRRRPVAHRRNSRVGVTKCGKGGGFSLCGSERSTGGSDPGRGVGCVICRLPTKEEIGRRRKVVARRRRATTVPKPRCLGRFRRCVASASRKKRATMCA